LLGQYAGMAAKTYSKGSNGSGILIPNFGFILFDIEARNPHNTNKKHYLDEKIFLKEINNLHKAHYSHFKKLPPFSFIIIKIVLNLGWQHVDYLMCNHNDKQKIHFLFIL
jgi:hypothetical protein